MPAPTGAPPATAPPAPHPGTAGAPRTATPPGTAARPSGGRGRAVGFTFAGALLVAVTVILVLFVVFNTQTVDVSLVFGNVHVSLVLALVVAAVLGGLVVGLAMLAVRGRRNRS